MTRDRFQAIARRFRTALGILTASAILTGAAGLATGVLPAAAANASAVTAHDAGWYDTATCRAFSAYERHPSGREFTRMARLARHADTYLRVDIRLWAGDRARHARTAVLRQDAGYARQDCDTNGDI